MKPAFIFHGTAGYPSENWFPWLKKELEALGYAVHVPQFPTPEGQTLENWFSVFGKYEKHWQEGTVAIGHSLGGAFLLRLLEKHPVKIRLAAFVAAPIGMRPIRNYDADRLFVGKGFDFGTIRKRADNFLVFQSDNDPLVSRGNGEKLAEELEVPLSFVHNAGHFNAKAGYTKFELLLEKIRLTNGFL